MKKLALVLPLTLMACTPANYQPSKTFRMQEGGHLVYHVEGFTNMGETKAGDGMKYLNETMKDMCQGDFTVVRENEKLHVPHPMNFLFWDGEAYCNKEVD
jgi:predicted lipoprotein